MILGAIIALGARNLISAIISLGIVGFGLTLIFLVLQAPDLAIVQIVVETLSLIILIAAVLKTTQEDTTEEWNAQKVFLYLGGLVFLVIFLKNSTLSLLKAIVTLTVSSFSTNFSGDGKKSETTLTFPIDSSV